MRGKIPFDPHIILYQGDAMQISNLVSQYNNSVANGEPMTGAKGVEKLVSSLNEISFKEDTSFSTPFAPEIR